MQKLSLEEKHHLLCVECFVHAKMSKGGVIAIGPSKCGKSIFSRYFALEAARLGKSVVYVTVDAPPEEVEQSLYEIIPEPRLRERISIVDCFSWRIGLPHTGNYPVINPNNLSELSITLDNLAKASENQCFIIDSLSSLVLDAGPEPTRMFLQILLARMKAYNALCLTTLGKDIHKESYENTLCSMFDGVLEFKIQDEENELKRYIRIYAMKRAMHPTAWHHLRIESSGFDFPESSSIGHSLYHLKSLVTR